MTHLSIPSARLLQAAALLILVAALVPYAPAQNPAQNPPQNPPAQSPSQPKPTLSPPADRERLNALAHKLLAAALKANALGGDELKPWHVKIDFALLSSYGPWDRRGGTGGGGGRTRTVIGVGGGTASMSHGTVEEWYAGRYQWSRAYTSDMETWSGAEWRVSHTERYEAKPKHMDFAGELLNLRVARPVINPLYQAGTLPPNAMLTVSRLAAGDGQTFNCVLIANSEAFGTQASAEWLMPTVCFDTDLHLPLVSSKNTAVQFSDFQPFQGRAVARTVRVLVNGQLDSEMKVTLLEDFDPAANPAALKPPGDAALQPYTIEAGDPPLEPIHEQGTTIPLLPDGTPFRGVLSVGAIVRKDGSVKAAPSPAGPLQGVMDAVGIAVSKWKYKPYLIDGQPVEVRVNIPYIVDGKPFVPSYERAGHTQGTYTP